MSESFPDGESEGRRDRVRGVLAAQRAETLALIAALTRDFDAIVAANSGVATDDEHDPDGSSTAFERAHVASLIDQAHAHLAELDQAEQRLDAGSYGLCRTCGQPIPIERLQARPTAATCVDCAAARPRR